MSISPPKGSYVGGNEFDAKWGVWQTNLCGVPASQGSEFDAFDIGDEKSYFGGQLNRQN